MRSLRSCLLSTSWILPGRVGNVRSTHATIRDNSHQLAHALCTLACCMLHACFNLAWLMGTHAPPLAPHLVRPRIGLGILI